MPWSRGNVEEGLGGQGWSARKAGPVTAEQVSPEREWPGESDSAKVANAAAEGAGHEDG